MTLIQKLWAQTTMTPVASQLPGSSVLQTLTNGIGGWALFAALIGIVISAVAWGLGQHSQNFHQAYAGRKGVLISAAAAVLIGAASHLVNLFNTIGQSVK